MASEGAVRDSEQRARGFMLAGPGSGVGKTTVTLSIMAALRERGLTIQPFKCGPDFIDGGHHTRVCGRSSRNLDGWMLAADANREILGRGAMGADICLVEGMMGLFDGANAKSDAGSSAEMAKWMQLPVILIVDASSMVRSAAALVHGFETFDPGLQIAGVIFNKVGGPEHYQMLKDALETTTKALPLGYLAYDEGIRIPERYLGLFTAGEDSLTDSMFSLLGELAETSIDLDRLQECAKYISPEVITLGRPYASHRSDSIRLGVARDKAFCFYYEDNLEALRRAGAEIVEFSPLADTCLRTDLDGLYFGGGYPELYAKQLAENRQMLASIKRAADAGLPIYAECGGLMYLAREILTKDGAAFPMASVLPLRVQMTDRLVNFGYTEVCFASECVLGPAGTKARGHSFHCSTIIDATPDIEHVYQTRHCLTGRDGTEGLRVNNVLASYIHLHFLSCAGMAEAFVKNAERANYRASIATGISAHSGIEF